MKKNGTISQKQFILNHLLKYGSITPRVALMNYGVFRLSARIADLREDGYDITTERTDGFSEVTGNKVTFATYRLVQQ